MSSTTISEHIKLRRARHQTIRHSAADEDPPLTHVVPPISQPNRFCNSAMSSFSLLPTSSNKPTKKKQLGFPQAASFRGMNCTAQAGHEVSVPSVIRSFADWNNKKTKKRNKKKKEGSYEEGSVRLLSESRDVDGSGGFIAVPDVWCGKGLGFSTDAVSMDPPRRNITPSRRKIEVWTRTV